MQESLGAIRSYVLDSVEKVKLNECKVQREADMKGRKKVLQRF